MTADTAAAKMEYGFLGRTGLKVSRLSFGSWVTFKDQVDDSAAYSLMHAAYKAGVNFFDNAEGYAGGESETIMGRSIKRGLEEKAWDRADLVISTKIFFGTKSGLNHQGLSRKHIVEGTQASLKRLQLDYVDVIFCHRPDPVTPIEETVRAMNHVIERGWAFYWGTSEWNSHQIAEAARIAERLGLVGPVVEQPQYNLFHRDRVELEYAPLYEQFGLGLTIWSPLACGILTGKYSGKVIPEGSRLSLENYAWLKERKLTDQGYQVEKTDELKPIAESLECSLAQLALAWCLKNQKVSTVIMGATSVAQLEENLKALTVTPKLTAEVMEKIDTIVGSKPVPDQITKQVVGIRGERIL